MLQLLRKAIRRALSNMQTRLVLILIIAICVIILIVGFTSYTTSKNVLKKELNEPQQQMLQISMNHIDQYLEEANNVAVQLSLNNYVNKFLISQNQNSLSNISQLYEDLATVIRNTAYIHSIYVYDTEQSSIVGLPQGYSSDLSNFNDSDWVSIVEEFGDKSVIVKQRDIPEGAKYKGSNITLFRKVIIRGQLMGVIAINLKHEDLFANLAPTDDFDSNSMRFIIDQNNTILYTTKNHSFDSKTVDFVLSNIREGNLENIHYQKQILLANQRKSPLTGWKYVSVVSQDSILDKATTIRDVVFTVSLVALLLGVIAIYYIN